MATLYPQDRRRAAAYTVLEAEARVVQRVHEMYTVEGLSIGEITRRINAEGIPRGVSIVGSSRRDSRCKDQPCRSGAFSFSVAL
jgi:hypothetical protein